jgi:hypothetical protein
LKYRAILQAAQIHEGLDEDVLQTVANSDKSVEKQTSIQRMLSMTVIVAQQLGRPCLVVLDAFFATSTAFYYVFAYLQKDGTPWIHLITRAKDNYVAYTIAITQQMTDKQKRAFRVKIGDVFQKLALFSFYDHPVYPDRQVQLYHQDLHWQGFLLRFVWVIDQGRYFVLMCSDLNLSAIEILRAYGFRSHIELSFRVLKHILGGFCYRFWTKACGLSTGSNVLTIKRIKALANRKVETLKAIERFVNLSIIACGILNYLALTFTDRIWQWHDQYSWMRTKSSLTPSEETTQRVLQLSLWGKFSVDFLKAWLLEIKNHKKIEDIERKVRPDHTLPFFYSD